MARILLTGGAGFIGSHLAERLLGLGHELTIVDNLNDFYDPAIKRRNLADIQRAGKFEFVEADICDSLKMAATFEKCRPEIVIHLAARAGVRPSLEQPLLYERTNVRGTLQLLELTHTCQARKFVFASSSSIYGTTSHVPFSESEANPNPISPYGVTKLAGEKLCYCYSHLYDFSSICLRFFTVYGPGQRPDLAIHKFARLIEMGKPVPFFGDGSSLRDYTFIDDIVDGIVAAASLERRFEIFNLGNSNPISLSDLIRHLEQAMGKKANLEMLPSQPGDMPLTYAEISKAARLLNFKPQYPFDRGLARFVQWFRKIN
jgi:UDP-glucuronate 4-epimerase